MHRGGPPHHHLGCFTVGGGGYPESPSICFVNGPGKTRRKGKGANWETPGEKGSGGQGDFLAW